MGITKTAILTLVLALVYAVLRYHQAFFGVHPSDQLPLFILNKALSFAALGLIVLAVSARPLAHLSGGRLSALKQQRRSIGLVGFGYAAVHSVISLAILTPDYYAKLYHDSGKMNTAGELSILTGTLAIALLTWQARLPKAGDDEPRRLLRSLGLVVLALTALHVAAMGWPGWFKPQAWPGGMPPITMLSFVLALAGLLFGLLSMGRKP